MSETTLAGKSTENANTPNPTLAKAGWLFFGFFLLFSFTLIKLPEQRIKVYIENTLINTLSQQGFTLAMTDSEFSLWLWPSYLMKSVTLQGPPPAPLARVDKIEFSPSLFSLLLGKMGGNFTLYQEEGILKGSVTLKGEKFSITYQAKKFDIGKIKLLAITTGIVGGGILNGKGSLDGDLSSLQTWQGELNLDLEKISVDPQNVMGFSIPRLSISEGKAQVSFEKGKAVVKLFQLGKETSPKENLNDDIRGTLSGDVTLNKSWYASSLNLRTDFGFSENVLKVFVLLETLLGAGKQADGKYHFSISGSTQSPTYTPIALTK